jgi:hypothetical protein
MILASVFAGLNHVAVANLNAGSAHRHVGFRGKTGNGVLN